ncbi:MAG: phenylalanine--tRNA ligase subunit alpha [Thermoplasmata archaeon]|nr:MAG: phenylalanine--tRNA ligase subunit alpha [Thermoplasmata archaeon]
MPLSEDELRALRALASLGEAGPEEVAAASGLEPDRARWALGWLARKGLASRRVLEEERIVPSELGRRALEEGLPEERALGLCTPSCPLSELGRTLGGEARVAVGELLKLGARISEGVLEVGDPARVREAIEVRKRALRDPSSAPRDVVEALLRRGLLERRRMRRELYRPTEGGLRALEAAVGGIGQLTPEILKSGRWRELGLRPYDVSMPFPSPLPGKPHPFVELIERIREIFLEMGFEEAETDYVVSAFWNMDALFTPQDHPAREMQDTFYTAVPRRIPIEDEEYASRVARLHELHWGGRWSREEAERALLRTHMTVSSIRALYAMRGREPPFKVFSIGRVFRREAIDSTHLPEFTQIDGIVAEEGATLRDLMGLLSEFLRKMGIREFKFRPSYFPYTEPSLEVVARVGGRELELFGSGIFRPEVTEPLGIEVPVLAWGGGLERLAMALFGLDDIREIYNNDVAWLRWSRIP